MFVGDSADGFNNNFSQNQMVQKKEISYSELKKLVIEKAIQESKIGINPQNMGDNIFLPIPPMTEDRRKQVAKLVHELGEQAKIAVRSARQDEMKSIKQEKEEDLISEDEQKQAEKEVQNKVDIANKTIEELVKNKEKEVLSI
jgi:ribosome recycling factor